MTVKAEENDRKINVIREKIITWGERMIKETMMI